MITEEGCASLVLTLSSKPSALKQLDLSYNHPGESGLKLLSTGLDDPNWALETLRYADTSGFSRKRRDKTHRSLHFVI